MHSENNTDRIVDWTQNEQLQSADAQLINLFVAFMSAINYLIKLNEMTWHEHRNLLAQTREYWICTVAHEWNRKLKLEVRTTCSMFVSRNVAQHDWKQILNKFKLNIHAVEPRVQFFLFICQNELVAESISILLH